MTQLKQGTTRFKVILTRTDFVVINLKTRFNLIKKLRRYFRLIFLVFISTFRALSLKRCSRRIKLPTIRFEPKQRSVPRSKAVTLYFPRAHNNNYTDFEISFYDCSHSPEYKARNGTVSFEINTRDGIGNKVAISRRVENDDCRSIGERRARICLSHKN